jgi:adenylate cyclase
MPRSAHMAAPDPLVAAQSADAGHGRSAPARLRAGRLRERGPQYEPDPGGRAVRAPGRTQRAHDGPDRCALAQRDILWWIIVALLCLALLVHVSRQVLQHRRKSLTITYVVGPTISASPGPTLLEISRAAGVPHMSLCGGRGRCTTCRVIAEAGQENMPQASEAELRALAAAKATLGARLACQIRPNGSATVFRLFRPDGRRLRSHFSEGKEAMLAVLFVDMRGFTSRTTGQLPYDVVHLLNRFFDAIVPPIQEAGGTVDKYLGDGLLAVFETHDPTASARAGLAACREIGHALQR